MRFLFWLLGLTVICSTACSTETVYHGSTPPGGDTREFLGISLTDSIDFIRWRLVLNGDKYALDCRYGIGKPNTNGFIDEKKVVFSGSLVKQGNYYQLQKGNKVLNLVDINPNLLHLLDKNRQMLIGNGGFSYALNNEKPIKADQFNPSFKHTPTEKEMTFQGRTPCRELSAVLGNEYRSACIKIKWYVILYTDSITGKPAYLQEGGMGRKKEAMPKGSWEIIQKNGKVIYKLYTGKGPKPVYLLRGDDNILFFTDPDGNLLVGDEDFSYTLNRAR